MKKLLLLLLSLTILFFTNPSANSHKEQAQAHYSSTVVLEDDSEIESVGFKVFTSAPAQASEIIIKDYYLFSVSYNPAFGEDGILRMRQLARVGLLGKVFDVSGLTTMQVL